MESFQLISETMISSFLFVCFFSQQHSCFSMLLNFFNALFMFYVLAEAASHLRRAYYDCVIHVFHFDSKTLLVALLAVSYRWKRP